MPFIKKQDLFEIVPPEAKQAATDRLNELRNKYPGEEDWDLLLLALAIEIGAHEEDTIELQELCEAD